MFKENEKLMKNNTHNSKVEFMNKCKEMMNGHKKDIEQLQKEKSELAIFKKRFEELVVSVKMFAGSIGKALHIPLKNIKVPSDHKLSEFLPKLLEQITGQLKQKLFLETP